MPRPAVAFGYDTGARPGACGHPWGKTGTLLFSEKCQARQVQHLAEGTPRQGSPGSFRGIRVHAYVRARESGLNLGVEPIPFRPGQSVIQGLRKPLVQPREGRLDLLGVLPRHGEPLDRTRRRLDRTGQAGTTERQVGQASRKTPESPGDVRLRPGPAASPADRGLGAALPGLEDSIDAVVERVDAPPGLAFLPPRKGRVDPLLDRLDRHAKHAPFLQQSEIPWRKQERGSAAPDECRLGRLVVAPILLGFAHGSTAVRSASRAGPPLRCAQIPRRRAPPVPPWRSRAACRRAPARSGPRRRPPARGIRNTAPTAPRPPWSFR